MKTERNYKGSAIEVIILVNQITCFLKVRHGIGGSFTSNDTSFSNFNMALNAVHMF